MKVTILRALDITERAQVDFCPAGCRIAEQEMFETKMTAAMTELRVVGRCIARCIAIITCLVKDVIPLRGGRLVILMFGTPEKAIAFLASSFTTHGFVPSKPVVSEGLIIGIRLGELLKLRRGFDGEA